MTTHNITGKKKHLDPPTRFEISIPSSVFNRMTLHLLDPISGKAKYGSRSKLIQMCLREYFESIASNGVGTLDARLAINLSTEGTSPSPAMLINTLKDCLIKGGWHESADLLISSLLTSLQQEQPNARN